MQEAFGFAERTWWVVKSTDPRALRLADEHYSRQTPGSAEFVGNGKKLVMLTSDERAVWAAIENMDPVGGHHWRCCMFRNDGSRWLNSDLIREATALTRAWWRNHYGGLPPVPLRTEVAPAKVRKKRDPGRCFLRAGWFVVPSKRGDRVGLVVLEAPAE